MAAARLAFPFVRDGYTHRLLKRTGRVCLVERTSRQTGGVHWEVVRLREERERPWPDGRITPAHEAYPATEAWGNDGWTYTTLKAARERFQNARICLGVERKRGGEVTEGVSRASAGALP